MSRKRIGLVLAVTAFAAAFAWSVLWSMNHSVRQEVSSADHAYTAYFMRLSEREGYREAVKIARGRNPIGHMTGDILFKGSCSAAELTWETPRTLALWCANRGTDDLVVPAFEDVAFYRLKLPTVSSASPLVTIADRGVRAF